MKACAWPNLSLILLLALVASARARSSRALLADEAVEAAPAPGLAEAPFVAPAEAPGPSVALSVGSGAALYERPDRCEKLGTMCQLVETTFDRRKGEELEINVFQNKCCDGRQCTYKKEYLRNGAKVKEWECTQLALAHISL